MEEKVNLTETNNNKKIGIQEKNKSMPSKKKSGIIQTKKYSMNKKNLKDMVLNPQIKSEKQKQTEMLSGDKLNNKNSIKNSFARNIIVVFMVLLLSFISIASVALAGNMKTSVVITANETNTRIVQAKLAELGYFDGSIDGIFDNETITAIKNYQRDNNLAETGSLDQTTAAAIGVTDNTQANTDLYLLAKLIHSEARGEPYEGQVAVGAVVLNRVDDAGFPNTLQGVIYQPWAFTALHDGQFNLEPNSTAYQAAQDALNGWDPTYGCLYYYNPVTATSSWIFSRTTIVTIGRHVFCI